MADQISIEDAFPVFRQRCGELADENLLLRGKIAGLERRLAELAQAAAQEPTLPEAPPATALPYEPGS